MKTMTGPGTFLAQHIIESTAGAFDDFAGGETDVKTNRKILGLA
jgi:hypothetical protein